MIKLGNEATVSQLSAVGLVLIASFPDFIAIKPGNEATVLIV